ncbi:MEDS domain-containing protein [Streptomyces sporangiiformans]|nr:MEDS domain-containing protein [Streptomyces sporangiiformans]
MRKTSKSSTTSTTSKTGKTSEDRLIEARVSTQQAHNQRPFDHRMAVFGSDGDFLAAALPFIAEGLAAPGEPPPVAIADPVRLGLLREALGPDAKAVGFIPHAEWYTGSAANAIAQGAGFLATGAGPGGRIHLLMEPQWAGRAGSSARETTEWIRYEALANLLFAPFAVTVLCAYDTRTAGHAIVDVARRAHPDTPVYEEPARLVRELDTVALPPPPPEAERLIAPEVSTLSERARARARGLGPADSELFAAAVASALLTEATASPLTEALLWGEGRSCVCELRTPARIGDPLAGFVPPAPEVGPSGQGLWFTRQVCAYVDIRDREAGGSLIRMQYAR